MRIRSFVIGGMMGASAMWLYHNRSHPFVNMMSLMAKDTLFKNNKKSSQNKSFISESSLKENQNHSSHAENESLIRSIIEQDSELKQEFSAITKDTYIAKPNTDTVASEQLQ